MPNRFNNGSSSYSDGTEVQGNQLNHWIEFHHISSRTSVSFKAFLTSFSDDYNSNWNLETVMGRMDPLPTFTNTTRTIAVDWDVPAATPAEARQNFRRVQTLNRLLHPSYQNGIMTGAPLFKVRMMNFIKNQNASGLSGAQQSGLIAIINGFSFNPDLDAGFIEGTDGQIFPKNIKMSCAMNIQHTLPARRRRRRRRQSDMNFTLEEAETEMFFTLDEVDQLNALEDALDAASGPDPTSTTETRQTSGTSDADLAEALAAADEIMGS